MSKSPSASTSAFLQSIIPAPVAFLSLFTSAAVIFAILNTFYELKQKSFSLVQNCSILNDFTYYQIVKYYSSSSLATALAFALAGLAALSFLPSADFSLPALRSERPSTIASATLEMIFSIDFEASSLDGIA